MVTQQFTTFIGRTHELSEIAALLADPACRLLTLVGPGGIGKTRLAVEATQTLDFPNGVHFVALQPVADAALLPVAIANAIGIQFFGADEPGTQLLNYLRERQTLLILDNFEHLLEAVDFIVEMLTAPGVKLLVTSRTALNIQAEWRYAVGGLEIPGEASPLPYEDFDAVKLFAERARRVRHNFSLSDHPADVIRICQLTEGMPLALELAAGWLKALSCAEIANEIQRGLDFLAADMHDVPERHRSMAAAFSQSWNLLSDDEQKVFQRMSVFRGGFTREAAENVTGATLQILASLVDKSLLRVDANGRYDVHELLRQFISVKLAESHEVHTTTYRHIEYFLKLAEQFEAHYFGHDAKARYGLLEIDLDNLRAALAYSMSNEEGEMGLQLAGALSYLWTSRSEGFEWLERMLASAPDAPASVRAKALHSAGYLAACLGHGQAQALCEEAVSLARQTNDKPNMAWALAQLGILKEYNLTEASALFEEGLMLFRELEDPFGINHLIRRRAWVAINEGNYSYAQSLLQEGRAQALEAGNKMCTAWILCLLGMLSWLQNRDLKQARALCQESLALFGKIDALIETPLALTMLAGVEQTAGNNKQAERLYQQALVYVRDLEAYQDSNIYIMFAGLAGLAATRGDLEWAARLSAVVKTRAINFYPLPMYAPTLTFERDIASVRARMDATAFAAAWEAGKAMTLEEIVVYALQGNVSEIPQTRHEANILTTREQEVLRLLATGSSNAQIAEKLIVSISTVKSHIHNISGKLNVESRLQVVARARDLNLL